MKRAGLPLGGFSRLAAISSTLLVGLALSPTNGLIPVSAAAAQAQIRPEPQADSTAAPANPQLATYAGTTGAGNPTAVGLQPFGLAVSGRYTFVADPINRVIRLLINNSELVFAGSGSLATEGDGFQLTKTELVGPYAVAVGHVTANGPFQVTAFDVYIADTFANQIRKVRVTVNPIASPTAFQTTQICTLAGAADRSYASDGDTADLSSATFKSPYALAWDEAHTILYVADSANNRVRAIFDPDQYDAGTPTANACRDINKPPSIKTVIGSDVLRYPRGLAVDNSSRLYVADTYNSVIRRFDPAFDGSGHLAASPAPSVVAGIPFSGSGKRASTFGGDGFPATTALLNQPGGVAVDSQGDLYIADTANHVVREVTTDGVIRTVAGTPQKSGPAGDGGPATLAQLSSPMAVAVRPSGDLVIADTGNNRVRILEARVANGPLHNIHLEAGNGTTSFSGEGQPPAVAQFSTPAAVLSQANGPTQSTASVPAVDGTRYVLDTFNQVVRAYTNADRDKQPTGDKDSDDVNTLAGVVPGAPHTSQSATAARFADPMGMALDATGKKLYVADTFNNVVRQIDLSSPGHDVSIIAGTLGKSGFAGDTDLATNALLSYPMGVAVDAAGDVFIADSYNGVVREVRNKRIYTVAGSRNLGFSGDGGPATQAGLYFPYGVAVDSATPPTLFISDSFDHRIRRVDAVNPVDSNGKPVDPPKNVIRSVAGDGSDGVDLGGTSQLSQAPTTAEFARPWGLAVDHSTLVVADFLNNSLRRVDPATGAVSTLAGTGKPGLANGVTPPDPSDGLPPNPDSRPPFDSGPAAAGEMNAPRGVSLLGDSGAMLTADSFNNRIRWFGPTQAGIQRTQVNFDPTNLSSASLPQSVTVTSTGSGLLAMGQVDLRADAQNFSLDPANNTCGNAALEPGSTCYFQVKFQPRSLGTHTGSVAIPNDAIGGAQLVTLNGQATAALAALSPPAVAIYQPLNGTASPATVTLTNNGSGLLEIKLITIKPGAFFSQSNNCPQFMPAQSSCQITVSLSQIGPSDTLAKAETLIVQDDAAGNPVSTETVPLTGSLAQPLTSFNRQELAFAQNVGTLSPPATFMLVNTGQVPLHLSDIHEDGDFSQTNNCPPVLAPGAGCAINVTFVPSTLGERDGYIVVVDDSLDSPHRIAITGVATVPSAQLGPGRLTFTSNVGVGTPAQSINLVNRGNGPLTIAGIATTGDFQAQPHCPSTLLPGIACSIGITFNPQGAGSRHGSLLVSDDSNGLPGSQQAVLLDGIAHLPVAALSTTSLTLAANLSGSVAQSITVSNTGDAPLNIRAIGISGPASGDYGQSTNCLGAVRPGGSCAVSVRFTPHGYGARGATLTIYDNGPGGAQSVVLNGTGTLPRPLLSATYLNFGGDRVGSPTAPQSIVLFNAGNGALAINGISASGVDFNMATTCGPRLDAGASCRITVTFLPRASGPRSGLVTVVDSAGSQQFTLSGVGT